MASKETWEKVKKYFPLDSKVDRFGDRDAISDEHINRLYHFRVWANTAFIVTRGAEISGHSENSYHYEKRDDHGRILREACATDQVLPFYDGNVIDLIFSALAFGFTGVGVYFHWSYMGKLCIGLHLDSRPLKEGQRAAMWMGILADGKQKYIELNFDNIRDYIPEIEDELILDSH